MSITNGVNMLEATMNNLASAIRAKHEEATATAARAVELAREAGELLLEAKSQLPHGAWSGWLAEHCRFSDRTARNYMRLANQLPQLDAAKRQRVANLPIRLALKELANPATQKDTKIPIFNRETAEISSLARWYDLVMDITLILFADGLNDSEIIAKTGFDPHEVGRIINPEKPVRFCDGLENGLLDFNTRAMYSAFVDWHISEMMAHACSEYKAQYLAENDGMSHTLPVLKVMERQWNARAEQSRKSVERTGLYPDAKLCFCGITDARIAIGLDREYSGLGLLDLLQAA